MRLRAVLFAALVFFSSAACSDDGDPAADAGVPTPAVTTRLPFLGAEQWPAGPGFGEWQPVGEVALRVDGEVNESLPLALGCKGMTYPDQVEARGYASSALRRDKEEPQGAKAAGDQYLVELADDNAAVALADKLATEFVGCVDGGDYEELPALDAGDGVRMFAHYSSYPDKDLLRTVLYAIGRVGSIVSVEVLQTDDPRTMVPTAEFAQTAGAAMELLAAGSS